MTAPREAGKTGVIDEVVGHVHEKLADGEAGLVEVFVRELYGDVAPEDLHERGALDLYGAALTLWGLTAKRRPGEVKVRVFSPRLEDHGWDCGHTILQVVCEDMPFLVDSVIMELNRHGLATHLIVHPVITVGRDPGGRPAGVWPLDGAGGAEAGGDAVRESLMHVEVDRQTDPEVLGRLQDDVARVLGDVRAAVEDWRPMREQLHQVVAELTERPPPVDPGELAEAIDFLRWIEDDHFTFLGCRAYDLTKEDSDTVALRSVPGTGLGILRPGRSPRSDPGDLDGVATHEPTVRRLTGEPAKLARARSMLVLTKANARATVHRPTYLDYVGVRRFSPEGEVVGEWRFLGLYTSVVYNNTPRDVPVLRQRIQRVLERAGFAPHSHNEKALLDVLETHPRDELLQTSSQELYGIALGILRLKDRPRVALFVRPDPYKRFLSCLVYVPRERYSTTVRERIAAVLTSAFSGTVADWSVQLAESALARLHVIVRTDADSAGDVDLAEVRDKLVRATRSWADDLHAALLEHHDEETGNRLFGKYAEAFPAAYREDVPARVALADIHKLEALEDADLQDAPASSLYQPLEASAETVRLKLLWPRSPRRDQAPLLSDVLPVLEHMGVRVTDQRPYELRGDGGDPTGWILDFGLLTGVQYDWVRDPDGVKRAFQEAFRRVWHAHAEDDGLNRLVLGAGLTWREVSVIRAYAKYLRQAGSTFSQSYMERTLAANPEIARHLVELFTARFDPDPRVGHASPDELTKLIEGALDDVASLDQDRILRSFLTVVSATTRTNYFQRDAHGEPKRWLALKLDPARIPFLPEPRPLVETFVYSPRVEGVHLRGARVARGGIRHSDRQEDFRTEVLGLMKAQTVKNAVIVPGGAKGGFVVKRPPPGSDRDALLGEVRACYATFIRGLLDLTDNRPPDAGGEDPAALVAPPDAVCYDGPDPYLVVAADKGTATFSDLANEIAAEYGYWLGDAFASGGSAGYDHKKIGITARGAWESVRWHFLELGTDPRAEDFTAVGVGDMSGDVFGNGMLWSRHVKLVAAFNHQHVFIDPDPDPEAAHAERERLFRLPRSTWADYDPARLSAGGGVYERTAKAVGLSPEARRALAVEAATLTPNELIRAVLLAPVDLLFNGGIGTYVKAGRETHGDAGDRANDTVRVNGAELRCRVVAEGGNLGFTQLGRIEYALAGGRVNTDFIDNSAGVDTSDHEVNIKILLNQVVATGDMTLKQRDELLAGMADDVAALVLRDNYRQAESLSVSESHAPKNLQRHAYALRGMERAGLLDRALEFLPDRKTLAERRAGGQGLTRPELALVLAHGKIAVKAALLDSDLPEDPYLSRELEYYLPAALHRFADQMGRHRLRREIIATHITNSMVNRAGGTFAFMVGEETGAAPPDIVRAYTVAREVFGLRRLWAEVEALDGRADPGGGRRVHAGVLTGMLREGRSLTERATVWLLRHRRQPLDVAAEVAALTPAATQVAEQLPELLGGAAAERYRQRVRRLADQDVPEPLARWVAGLGVLLAALDISDVAAGGSVDVHDVAAVHFHVSARLEIEWLRSQVADDAVLPESHWHELAWASLREDLNAQHRTITASVLARAAAAPAAAAPSALVDAWIEENTEAVRRVESTLGDLKSSDTVDLAMASVGLRELRRLAQTGGSG